jgi:glycerophosphoryl diester phosphodiesterase
VDRDVVMTQDGEVLVSQDIRLNPDIVRDASGAFITERKLVKDLTLAEVQAYDVGRMDPASAYSRFFPAQFAATLHRILLEEDIVETSEIQSFDWRCLYELQRLDPRVKTAYLTEWDNEPGTPSSFFDPDPAKAGLWTGGVLVKDHGDSILQMVKDLGGTCWEPEDVELTKATLDEAHPLGLKVVVWTWPEHSGTVFDEALVGKLIDWGVDGIITDDPGRLVSMLAARGDALPVTYR